MATHSMESNPPPEEEKMIVDDKPSPGTILATPGTIPSVVVKLHPLVIMNISEHWTRIRAQNNAAKQVFGALIGKQSGRNIEIMNSFELRVDIVDEVDVVINGDYFFAKEEQYKQVFSELDFIGWYTTGEQPNEDSIKIHKQVCHINDCSIMLQLNPNATNTINQLPVKLYESVIDIVNDSATMLFVPLPYTLTTDEGERISIDHVARMLLSDNDENSVAAEYLQAQYSSIRMLYDRVKLILRSIRAFEDGEITLNQEILRDAYSLSQRLPVIQNELFRKEFFTQSNDVALMAYFGALTKGCNDTNNFVSKFNLVYDRDTIGKRIFKF